ncbi:MAG: SGNH/GDSL hydrolase family protein [Pseudomonadales bacterium]|nr:SGNH/GDSL hydrolase family protein [Pseudomonadales bacterium]
MMKIIISILLALWCLPSIAQDRVLVMGDSWASFIHWSGALQKVVNQYQAEHAGSYDFHLRYLQLPGTKAYQWNSSWGRFLTYWKLRKQEPVDVVILSLGGNDFIELVDKHQMPSEQKRTFQEITNNIQGVIDQLQQWSPGVRILLLGYDYPNFEESLENWLVGDPDRGYWKSLGRPDTVEANRLITDFEEYKFQLAEQMQHVQYVNNLGLMQSIYGLPKHGIPADELLEPSSVDFVPGGDINFASPAVGMLTLPGHVDSIHLSLEGYRLAMDRLLTDFLLPLLQNSSRN